jgi:hypothetical protein
MIKNDKQAKIWKERFVEALIASSRYSLRIIGHLITQVRFEHLLITSVKYYCQMSLHGEQFEVAVLKLGSVDKFHGVLEIG